jgi:hypothetical protein
MAGGSTIWRGLLLAALMAPQAVAQDMGRPAPQDAAPGLHQDAPFEAATVQVFLAACDRDISQCDFKLRMALLDKLPAPDGSSVCLKDAHYQDPVIAWLKQHRETWPMATEDGIYVAFRSLYPCP